MKNKQLKGSIILFATAAIWGIAFVAQSEGAKHLSAFSFCFFRYLIGGFMLLPIAINKSKTEKPNFKYLLLSGAVCGIFLALSIIFQQSSLKDTDVGKAGFITATYIVGVPLAQIFLGKKNSPLIWVAVFLALIGLYTLCVNGKFSLVKSDVLLILCACFCTVHILIIDHFSPRVNNYALACVQFFVASIVSFIPMIFTELPSLESIQSAWIPLLYVGILSTAVAYTGQIIGQKYVAPAIASLIMSLESSISLLAGWIILGQRLSAKELIGCGFMLFAIIIAQVPDLIKKQNN